MARYALVIGISRYDNFRNLDKAATDAAAIARILQTHGQYQVEPLPKRLVEAENRWELATDKKLTGKDLGQALETFLLERAKDQEALIYFAGHGFEVPGLGRKKKGYLATSDSTSDGRNAILFSDLNDLIRESSLSNLVLILDCCHAGSFLERTMLESTLTAFKEKKDYYLITACRSFERAREGEEHGVFTAAVLKGLQRDNADSEGMVTGDRLFDFVQRELRQSGQEPTRMGIGRSLTIVTYPSKVQVIPELDKNIIPYRGLEPFEKEQAEFFFGRNQVVENIWKVLDLSNFVAVIGPSGSGKSSVIRAGLAPWLEASGWQILKPMRPGISPLAKLTATFEPFFQDNHHQKQLDELIHINSKGLNQLAEQLPGSAKFLLVVDQFEEVFTLSRVEERERFIEILTQLSEAPYSRLAVVTTLRADFLEPCLQYPTLTQLIQTQAIFIPPLIGADLEQAISEPARKMGYVLESGLLGDILQDVSQEPGCLPLLQFTLLELWARRDHSTQRLLRLAYHDIDRLSGALDRFAEQFYEGLSKTKQTWVKRICLKLIRPSKEEKDIRQRTTKYKLLAMANEVRSQQELLEVLTELVNKRLLVIGKDNSEVWVDLAHEALMNEWKRFKNWRAQDRELRQLIDRLENALQEWQKNPTEDNLMMGGLLASVRDYWHVLEPELDTRMKNFSQSSFLHEQNRIAQLQESEEKFSKAFRFSAVAMALTTFEESIIIDVNDSFLKGSGYKREEVIGRTSPELNIWVDLALRDELKQTLERSGAVQNLEITFRRKSGELGVALLSADIITLKGKRCMLVGTIDITERKQAEKALQQSEARFRVIAENEACALLVYQNNQLCYVNLAAESITGYSREELLSMKAWELVHPDFREIAKQRALARQRGETVLSRYEIKILTKFGEERWVDYTAGLISFEGEPAVLATAYDITARKYSEEALRESEEKFSIAFHSSPAAMVISEFKDFYTAHYLDINDALLKIVGYQREELIGKPIIDLNLWVDISERTKMLSVLQESGSVRNFVMQFRQKSGEVGRALLSCEKINLKGKPCLLTMVIDVIDISSLDKKFL